MNHNRGHTLHPSHTFDSKAHLLVKNVGTRVSKCTRASSVGHAASGQGVWAAAAASVAALAAAASAVIAASVAAFAAAAAASTGAEGAAATAPAGAGTGTAVA